MKKEITRSSWARFCKKFSQNNRYRLFNVNVINNDRSGGQIVWESPFMGLALEKKGRLIDGFRLFSVWADPQYTAHPIASFKQPTKLTLEKDKQGNDVRLIVHTKDGATATVEMISDRDPNQHRTLVEKVAYSMYEHRGYSHGGDRVDWIEAERKVSETEAQFA
jgi:hypothetical protein